MGSSKRDNNPNRNMSRDITIANIGLFIKVLIIEQNFRFML